MRLNLKCIIILLFCMLWGHSITFAQSPALPQILEGFLGVSWGSSKYYTMNVMEGRDNTELIVNSSTPEVLSFVGPLGIDSKVFITFYYTNNQLAFGTLSIPVTSDKAIEKLNIYKNALTDKYYEPAKVGEPLWQQDNEYGPRYSWGFIAPDGLPNVCYIRMSIENINSIGNVIMISYYNHNLYTKSLKTVIQKDL